MEWRTLPKDPTMWPEWGSNPLLFQRRVRPVAGYCPKVRQPITPTAQKSDILPKSPTMLYPLFRRPIIPTAQMSEILPITPTSQKSDSPIVRNFAITPTAHYSDSPIVRQKQGNVFYADFVMHFRNRKTSMRHFRKKSYSCIEKKREKHTRARAERAS